MIVFESLRLALTEIFSNKIRSALALFGFVLGGGALLLLLALSQGAKSYTSSQIKRLGSNLISIVPGKPEWNQGSATGENNLTLEEVKSLKEESTSFEVTATLQDRAPARFGHKTRTTLINGVTATYPLVMRTGLDEGRFILDSQVQGERRVAIIGKTVEENFFGNQASLGQRIVIADQKFTVIGVIKKRGRILGRDQDDVVYVPITAAQNVFGTDRLSSIVIRTKDPKRVSETIALAQRVLGRKLDKKDFSIGRQEETLAELQKKSGDLEFLLLSLVLVALFLGGTGFLNTLLSSVAGRAREIGLRKTVGARAYHILLQLIIEAVTLSTAGGVLGILLGLAGAVYLKGFFPTQVTAGQVFLVLGVSAAIGLVFGAPAALKAARVDPGRILGSQ